LPIGFVNLACFGKPNGGGGSRRNIVDGAAVTMRTPRDAKHQEREVASRVIV
jgi:hypothetical protein